MFYLFICILKRINIGLFMLLCCGFSGDLLWKVSRILIPISRKFAIYLYVSLFNFWKLQPAYCLRPTHPFSRNGIVSACYYLSFRCIRTWLSWCLLEYLDNSLWVRFVWSFGTLLTECLTSDIIISFTKVLEFVRNLEVNLSKAIIPIALHLAWLPSYLNVGLKM